MTQPPPIGCGSASLRQLLREPLMAPRAFIGDDVASRPSTSLLANLSCAWMDGAAFLRCPRIGLRACKPARGLSRTTIGCDWLSHRHTPLGRLVDASDCRPKPPAVRSPGKPPGNLHTGSHLPRLSQNWGMSLTQPAATHSVRRHGGLPAHPDRLRNPLWDGRGLSVVSESASLA